MSDDAKHLVDQGNLREKLVTTAVKFLTNPDVLRLTSANKDQFLRSKGLTDAEIQAAVARASEHINFQSFSSDLMLFHNRRNNWFKDHVLPIIVYGGFAYGAYWFYKNCIQQLLFVEKPKSKSTAEVLSEVKTCLESLTANIEALRREVAEAGVRGGGLGTHIETVKTEIASVKGILLNRNQFPSIKTRSSPPSIPAWQRQSEEAASEAAPPHDEEPPSPAPPASPAQRGRSQRSESGGSNSSEEHATKNSDSSLEIIT